MPASARPLSPLTLSCHTISENRKLLKAHKAAVVAAAAAAGGSSSSTSERPLVTTSWDEEGGGPDVAGSGINAVGLERLKPLINQQVAMKNREQITESLFTGKKVGVWLVREKGYGCQIVCGTGYSDGLC